MDLKDQQHGMASPPVPNKKNAPIYGPPLNEVPTQPLWRFKELPYFQKIVIGFISLLKGMRITMKYFANPKTVVTQQYPENRSTLKLADRNRSQLVMNHDENGFHKCTSCHICEEACPNASIHVVDRTNPAVSKKELGFFVWRLDSCTFCNLCVLVCPFSCLKMNAEFESSVYDQRLLIYNLNKYSGPTAQALAKLPDDETRQKSIEPRLAYEGPVALNGYFMAGIPKEFFSKNSNPAESPASENSSSKPEVRPL